MLAATGIVLGAIYMLHMAARIVWGPLKTPDAHGHEHDDDDHAGAKRAADHRSASPDSARLPKDLNAREIALLVPLALAAVILGVYPNIVLKTIEKPVEAITQAIPESPSTAVAAK